MTVLFSRKVMHHLFFTRSITWVEQYRMKSLCLSENSNLTLKAKILSIEARKPFFILGNSVSDEKPETGPIEPENIGVAYTRKEACASLAPRLLGNLDSNQDSQDQNLEVQENWLPTTGEHVLKVLILSNQDQKLASSEQKFVVN
jgi:hypothetical protein